MQKTKNNIVLIFSILFLLATVSAKFSYMMEGMLSSLFKYGISFMILCLTFTTANRTEIERKRLGKYIQLEWIFVFLYGVLFVLQHQVFSSGNRLAFGVSMGVANGMQKLAALFIGCYILKRGDKTFCRAMVITFLIIIIVDSITTLQAVQLDDQALRQSSMGEDARITEEVEQLGVCNVNHIFSYIICIPILFLITVNQTTKFKKFVMICILLLLVVAVVNSGFTMGMTIMMIALFVLLVNVISPKPAVKIAFAIIVLFLVFFVDWAEIVLKIGTVVNNPSVKERLGDIYTYLRYGSQGDAMSSRTDGYIRGLQGFLQSPILGNIILDTKQTSGHSTIIDLMSNWGIIGIFVYSSYLFYMFKASTFFVKKKDRFYVIITAIIFIISFVVNPIGGYVNGISSVAVFFAAAAKLVFLNNPDEEETDKEVQEQIVRKSIVK